MSVPLIDIHTQLMPERFQRETQARLRADYWHPRYSGSLEELAPQLVQAGVSGFVLGPFAVRDGQAESLNFWTANARDAFTPHAIGFATFHPDDVVEQPRLVSQAFGTLGLIGAKLYPAAGSFVLDDPRLDPVYGAASERRLPVFLHAGRRPEGGSREGARALAALMRRFPELVVIVAYMGADQLDGFFDLCSVHEGINLDCAMVFNNYLGGPPPFEQLLEYQDRMVFGTGFPNIPYAVESAIRAIRDLGLGRALEEKIFSTNAARILGIDPQSLLAAPEESEPLITPDG